MPFLFDGPSHVQMHEVFDSGSKAKICSCPSKQASKHCLNSGHRISKCTYNQGKPCGINNCVRYNHPLLHVNPKIAVFYEDRDSDCSDLPDLSEINFEEMECNSNSDKVQTFHVDVSHMARASAVSLQTLVCDVKAGGKSQRIIVLLDSGSNSTLIDQALASKLRAKVVQGPVTRKVNYVDRQVEVESSLVSFVLTDVDGSHSQVLEAWTVKDLAKKSFIIDWSEQKRKFEHRPICSTTKTCQNRCFDWHRQSCTNAGVKGCFFC